MSRLDHSNRSDGSSGTVMGSVVQVIKRGGDKTVAFFKGEQTHQAIGSANSLPSEPQQLSNLNHHSTKRTHYGTF